MKKYSAKIISIKKENYCVKTFQLERPSDFKFQPGQFCMLAPDENTPAKPFSVSSNPEQKHLGFSIKKVGQTTAELFKKKIGDTIIVECFFGKPFRRDCAKYAFIAGGTGITPVISFLRQMKTLHQEKPVILFYSNKLAKDFLFEDEIRSMKNVTLIKFVTKEKKPGCENCRITKKEILKHVKKPGEYCWKVIGPPVMVAQLNRALTSLGVNPLAI